MEENEMTFNEYQRGVMRTVSDIAKATPENMLFNGVLGASGEAGELADLLKRSCSRGILMTGTIISRSAVMSCITWV